MQAVIDKVTQIVVFLFPDSEPVSLTESGLSGPVKCPDISADTHELMTVPDNDDYVGGAWRVTDGQWVIADQDRYAALSAARVSVERAVALEASKSARVAQVEAIIIELPDGRAFNGDEKSQDRMARAIAGMEDDDILPWVLADDRPVTVTRAELRAVLRQAGLAMAEIWVAPYVQAVP